MRLVKILKYSCWSSEDAEAQQDYVNQVLIEGQNWLQISIWLG